MHILKSSNISGAENVVADICMMFRHEHEMAYCSCDGPIRYALADRDVPYIPIKKMCVSELNRVLKAFKPDIIHAHDVSATVLTAVVSRHIPFISHLHVNSVNMRKIGIKPILYMLAAKKAKHIIVVSESCLNDYVFASKVQKKTTCLTNIIHTPRIEMLVGKDTGKYTFDFVYLGRLTQQKNPVRVARIASTVLKQCPTATFGIIGEGELRSEMETVFQSEGVADRVVFTGRLSYPYKALQQAKCMLVCSLYEGTPIAVLEAMALGVPIVSTPVDGIINLVKHGINGYLSDDNSELVEFVRLFLTNKEHYQKMTKKTKDYFSKINNEQNYCNELNKIYDFAGRE